MTRPARRLATAVVVVLAAAVLPALGASTAGAASDDPPFRTQPNQSSGGFDAQRDDARVDPSRYTAVQVDVAAVRDALDRAPAQSRGGSTVFAVPTPTGGLERFTVQRTEVMESKLAAAHPEIATYSGRSLDHPGTTIAMDTTPMGFHAAVRGPFGQRAYYVDPAYNARGTRLHLSYYGAAVSSVDAKAFVEREAPQIRRAASPGARTGAKPGQNTPGAITRRRVYRLALTSDPAYAAFFGTENVLAEKVTLINRVDQIYNDDLAIQLRLVNQTDALNLDTDAKATGADGPCGAHACFDPPADPTDPDSAGQLSFCDVPTLGRNRTVLGELVGASNYDIGHIALGVNGGGIAYLGVVGADYKGGGCTGLPQPEGDFFAIDYVAHEMGHEFGANHTFNGVQYACSGGNRNGPTSVEPGSGSSVMAYAGICLQDDLQPHTDPYFSQRTIDEVSAYTQSPNDDVIEVQTISLRGFGTDGDQVRLNFPGAKAPVVLTRGSTYDRAGIETAVQKLTGLDVTIAQWGYDPYDAPTDEPAAVKPVDDTGFQVIFAPTRRPDGPGPRVNEPSLTAAGVTRGVTADVSETAKGGRPSNGGSMVLRTINHNPKVKAPHDKTIPLRTPFTLKGAGYDKDGDTLTYLWEQNDVGATGVDAGTPLVSNTKRTGPLFRVFGRSAKVSESGTLLTPSPGENTAGTSATRHFPDLAQVLAGNTNARTGKCPPVPALPRNLDNYEPVKASVVECYSEFLPVAGYRGSAGSRQPAMHFRLTARDDYPTAGGTGFGDVTLRLSRFAGPFLVSSQSAKTARVLGGSLHRITWEVNGTQKLAGNVRILLSSNGGRSFEHVLTSKTANDGFVRARFPRIRTKQARIMIQARGNYFYAVNDSPFRIVRFQAAS